MGWYGCHINTGIATTPPVSIVHYYILEIAVPLLYILVFENGGQHYFPLNKVHIPAISLSGLLFWVMASAAISTK